MPLLSAPTSALKALSTDLDEVSTKMNATPEIMARKGEPDPDSFVKADAFTKETYRDLYPAINPTRPNLSQSGKVVIITGASRGLGRSVSIAHTDNFVNGD